MAKKKKDPELENLRSKAYARAAVLAANGRLKESLALGVVAPALKGPDLEHLLSLEDSQLAKEALRLLDAMPARPPRKAPPWGWSFMAEILEEYRLKDRVLSPEPSALYLALVHLAHFAPLYRALMARAAWDLWKDYQRPRFESLALLLHRKAPALEKTPPFRGKAR